MAEHNEIYPLLVDNSYVFHSELNQHVVGQFVNKLVELKLQQLVVHNLLSYNPMVQIIVVEVVVVDDVDNVMVILF